MVWSKRREKPDLKELIVIGNVKYFPNLGLWMDHTLEWTRVLIQNTNCKSPIPEVLHRERGH